MISTNDRLIGMTPLEAIAEISKMELTREGPLSQQHRDTIRRALNEWMVADSISNAQMGRLMGCSAGLTSQIRAGTYAGDEDRWLRKAHLLLAERAQKQVQGAVASEYVATSIGRHIMTVCERTCAMPCIGKVILPSGAGKTVALREFARRKGDRAVFLQAGTALSTSSGLLRELAQKLHIQAGNRWTVGTLFMSVRDELAKRYGGGVGNVSPMCIIVDEATTLSGDALNLLRNLHDDEQARIAVILADTWRLDGELHSRHGIAGGYEQLRSRFGAVYCLKPDAEISLADVKLVTDSLLEGLGYKDAKLTPDAYRHLHKLAQGEGKFRNIFHRLHAATAMAESMGAEPTFNVSELDFAGMLCGAECELEHAEAPFRAPMKKAI